MTPEWGYDIIAPLYDDDMGASMPFHDLDGYLELLPKAPADILEIGCGTGRLTLPLADRGFSVTAIDRSAPMLEQLQNKLHAGHDIEACIMDARHISLCGPFDSALFGYSGFQYLVSDSDSSLFLEAIKGILAPSGSLILDIFIHCKNHETSDFVRDYERRLEDGRVLSRWKRVLVDHGQSQVERKYVLTDAGEQHQYRTVSHQRLYTPESLVTELKRHGFKLDMGIFDYQSRTKDMSGHHRFFTARFIPD
jgi:SAM-dependent methyltransferase